MTLHRIIALWAVPRSVSIAFEKMIRVRGDFEVFTEVFEDYYYYGIDWQQILHRILAASARSPVFVREMAFQVKNCMSFSFLANFSNSFIIRDPRYSLVSHYRLKPNFTLEEAGYHQQYRLMRLSEQMSAAPAVVIDGRHLRSNPARTIRHYCDALGLEFKPEALSWARGGDRAWEGWGGWVSDVTASTGFHHQQHFHDELLAEPRVRQAYDACIDLYLEMRKRVEYL